MFVNDVGGGSWEEINDGIAGSNFGWPGTEGYTSNPNYRSPLYAYAHGSGSTTGCALTGGTFYNPPTNQFPSEYLGTYFFSDYCSSWIRRFDPSTGSVTGFATGASSPVDLKVGPDGSLYYLGRSGGKVMKVAYTGSGAPQITSHPSDQTVSVGQGATFTVAASGDPPLSYQWQRNGAPIGGATASSYTLSSAGAADNGAQFRCVVTNTAGSATSNSATLTVSSNTAPTGTITAPAVGTLYSGGQTINYAGTGTDTQDGTLAPSAFTWWVDFHHDTHTHPFLAPTSGSQSGSFTIPTSGETSANVWYRIYLRVQDSGGMTQTSYREVQPRRATLRLETNPGGLQVTLEGQPLGTPALVSSVVGMVRTLGVVSPQTMGGINYEFESWSDGGAATHNISTPASDTTYTAVYRVIAAPPTSEAVSLIRQDCTGFSNCYTSLAAWEAAFGGINFGASGCSAGNLVCANKIAVAQIDGAWSSADTTPVLIDGWTTDATRYIRIYTTPAARHDGKWNTSKYRLEVPSGDVLRIYDNHVQVEGIQVRTTAATSSSREVQVYSQTAAANDIRISHCIIRGSGANSSGLRADLGVILRAWNNVIYDARREYFGGIRFDGSEAYLYNNTIINSYYGIRSSTSGSVRAKNNLVMPEAGGSGYSGTFHASSNYNASSDGTTTGGANDRQNQTFSFVNAAGGDYHLGSGDSGAKGFGTNLSTDASLAFGDDIDGEARTIPWDIGADKVTGGFSNLAPSAVSVTPSSGIGSSQTFSFVSSDANGYTDIATMQAVISADLNPTNSCYTHYDRALNAVLLLNDAATGWIGPLTLGASGTIQNNQCIVNGPGSSRSGSGNNLTVNLALTFKAGYGGVKNIFLSAQDTLGQTSAWLTRGPWTVP